MTADTHGAALAAGADLESALDSRLAILTLEQKVRLLTGADFWSLAAEPAIGLRRIVLSDGPAGVRGELWDERDPSANIPSPTALAATWDTVRVERMGRLLAAEARRKGVDVLLAPTVNLHRSPFGGRHFECFSEDPLLTATIGSAFVDGVQGGGVAATVKHFVGNDSETERTSVDARIDQRALRELYLAPFETIVTESRAWAVMAAYNKVNGITMTEHPLLAQVLVGEWGFDGVVMSDWFATRSVGAAGNASLDLAMPGPTSPWTHGLVEAVRAGEVPETVIDEKVRRILRLASRVGALAGLDTLVRTENHWSEESIAHELRETAAAGFVLLRNEQSLLPLDPITIRRVAVIGPNAAAARTLGGGSALVLPPYTIGPLDGLGAALGPDVELVHAEGVRSSTRLAPASLDNLRLPDSDRPGIQVAFLAADGRVLGTEERTGTSFTWLGSYRPDLPLADVDTVEIRATLLARTDGEHQLGCSALGRVTLQLGGDDLLDADLSLPEGSDPIEGLIRPPQAWVPVTLSAGATVPIVARVTPRGQLPITALQLNLEPPRASAVEELDRAVRLAADADVAIVVVGTTEEVESEGFDRDSLALPGDQDELVRRVVDANPRTVVVVNAGAPVLLPWATTAPAILMTWFPGQEFGHALADVLLGRREPGGRLPTVWPGQPDGPIPGVHPDAGSLPYTESIHIGQRGYDRAGVTPAFPFGHGLGYTTWEYRALRATVEGDTVGVEATVRNTGDRPGRQVVQFYASRPDSNVDRPVTWMIGFTVVDADAGDEITVRTSLPLRTLQHWDVDTNSWAIEPGNFTIHAGSSAKDLHLFTPLGIA